MALAAIRHIIIGHPDQLLVNGKTQALKVGEETNYEAGTITAEDFQTTVAKIKDIHKKDLITNKTEHPKQLSELKEKHQAEKSKTLYDKSVTVEVVETIARADAEESAAATEGDEGTATQSQTETRTTTIEIKLIQHPNQNNALSFVKHHPYALTSAAVALIAVGAAVYNPETTVDMGLYAWKCLSTYPRLQECLTEGTTYATQLYHTFAAHASTTVSCLANGPTTIIQLVPNPTVETLTAAFNTATECLTSCKPQVEALISPNVNHVQACVEQCLDTAKLLLSAPANV